MDFSLLIKSKALKEEEMILFEEFPQTEFQHGLGINYVAGNPPKEPRKNLICACENSGADESHVKQPSRQSAARANSEKQTSPLEDDGLHKSLQQ